nr:cholecystokinin receptor type A-like [Danaus plexippus plexippus]
MAVMLSSDGLFILIPKLLRSLNKGGNLTNGLPDGGSTVAHGHPQHTFANVLPPLIRKEGQEKVGKGKGQPALALIRRNAAIKGCYTPIFCERVVLYTKIAVGLWQSSLGLEQLGQGQCCATQCPRAEKPLASSSSHKTFDGNMETKERTPAKTSKSCRHKSRNCHHLSHLSRNVLRARRGVVRMLIVVVLTFAVCNLPFHARKMWQYWSSGYQGTSNFSALLTPLTFLITYFNSGINPLLYAFLSKNFRKGMKELLFCNIHGKRKSDNLILLNRVGGIGLRRSSTRSTRANCSTVTMAPNGES